MFGLKRKARKAQAQAQVDAPMPKAYEVWYKDSVGQWQHASTHTVRSDANVSARCFTIAQTQIREIY